MKKYILPITLNLIFIILIPYFLNTFKVALIIQGSYISIGIALYLFISSNIFCKKHDYNLFLLPIGLLFTFIAMKLLLTDVLYMYLLLYAIMILLGSKLGNAKRRILNMKNPTNEN